MSLVLKSAAFSEGGWIPEKYTCDGDNVSPPLEWSGLPAGTASLALICDDPDAPMGIWVHWLIYNIPAETNGLPEGVPASKSTLDNGAIQGTNSWGRIGYGGPCPPSGTHRYFFRLYALGTKLELKPGATKAQVLSAMEGHVLDKCELMGRYSKR